MTNRGNPNHDRQGRFASSNTASGPTPTKKPNSYTQHRSHAEPERIQARQQSKEELDALTEKNVRTQWAQGWRPKGRPQTLEQYLVKAKAQNQ